MTSTISAPCRDFVTRFHNNPVGRRVFLPDGSFAIVRQFIQDDNGSRLYRVQGVQRNGRFCKLPPRTQHWYTADELRLVYYSVSVNPEWSA